MNQKSSRRRADKAILSLGSIRSLFTILSFEVFIQHTPSSIAILITFILSLCLKLSNKIRFKASFSWAFWCPPKSVRNFASPIIKNALSLRLTFVTISNPFLLNPCLQVVHSLNNRLQIELGLHLKHYRLIFFFWVEK